MSRGAVVASSGRMARPFFPMADWLWNPIKPTSPVLDTDNTTIVAALSAAGTFHNLNGPNYGPQLIFANEITPSTPRYDVAFANVPAWGPDPFGTDTMPVPSSASVKLPLGSDKHLSVFDPYRGKTYNVWQAVWNGTSWSGTWGASANLYGDGREVGGAKSTGSGLARPGAVIRVSDVQAGVINHALFFATDIARPTTFRYPAPSTDGSNGAGVASNATIPEGARVQLDPSINLAAISGISQIELMVGVALQKYGAYCGDNGGSRMGFLAEVADDFGPTDQNTGAVFEAAGYTFDYFDMTKIPWSSLRVLRQWDGY